MDETTTTNNSNTTPGDGNGGSPFDRRDELISRVIDGEASERDWSALRTPRTRTPRCGPT